MIAHMTATSSFYKARPVWLALGLTSLHASPLVYLASEQ